MHYVAVRLKQSSVYKMEARAFDLTSIHLLQLLLFPVWTKQPKCLTVKGLH